MSFKKEFLVLLTTKEGQRLNFFGEIHQVSKPEDLSLDPVNFYKKLGGKIPEGIHHEIQWEAVPLICKGLNKDLVHIHKEKEKNFVCWTQQIHTEEESIEVIKVAALGILYGTKTEKDFAEIFKECKESMSQTITKLSKLCDLEYEPLLVFNKATIEATKRHNIVAGKIFFL